MGSSYHGSAPYAPLRTAHAPPVPGIPSDRPSYNTHQSTNLQSDGTLPRARHQSPRGDTPSPAPPHAQVDASAPSCESASARSGYATKSPLAPPRRYPAYHEPDDRLAYSEPGSYNNPSLPPAPPPLGSPSSHTPASLPRSSARSGAYALSATSARAASHLYAPVPGTATVPVGAIPPVSQPIAASTPP